MKAEIAEQFGPAYAELAIILNEVRGWAKGTLPTYNDRRDFFEGIVNGDPDPVELIRQVTEGRTLVMVEHDMADRGGEAEALSGARRLGLARQGYFPFFLFFLHFFFFFLAAAALALPFFLRFFFLHFFAAGSGAVRVARRFRPTPASTP